MLRKSSRIFVIGLVVILILVLVLAILMAVVIRRSFPKVDGEVKIAGLDGTVDILRDEYGIPHIYASSAHDLFFADGYVHAQDRFWQMDFGRHIGSGNLAEMFGESQVETDIFLRSLGWAKIAETEVASLDDGTKSLLQAYADGVNAYLADHQGSALSLEYAILKLLTPDYVPEPWTLIHSLTWPKVMAWDLGSDHLDGEIERAILTKTLTPEQLEELHPPYPSDHPVIVPDFPSGGTSNRIMPRSSFLAELSPSFELLASRLDALSAAVGLRGEGIGSNSWVVSGSRTASGKPLLANDMHLGVQMPSIWYEAGLHCTLKSPECPFDIVGFTFPGVPLIIVGHNDRISWGFTNVGPDVIDLYIEKINPDNPNQYEVNGEWMDMELVRDTIRVAGGEPVEIIFRYTRHGPVVSDSYGSLKEFSEESGIELPEGYAIAMRWTALEPAKMMNAFAGFNRAQNWEEFRQAARDFSAPAQNIVYADVDGNIAYQTPGWIPIRKDGHDGRQPVPGWTDDYEWQGYIPFDELPNAYNPLEGYIATANNAVAGAEYSYSISPEFAFGYRAKRIVEMLESAPGKISMEYFQQIHGDNENLSAEYMVPVLMQVPLEDERLQKARSILEGWDYQNHMDLSAPALYNAFWRHLLAVTFRDELPEDYWPDGSSRWFEVMRKLVNQTESAWWDDQATPEIETRDQMVKLALNAAVDELEDLLGEDPQDWKWGDLHTVIFRNQTLGESGVAPIEALFNRGPYRTSGGREIVNATGWDSSVSYELVSLPSMRMILDMAELENSIGVNTTGQSGHAFHPHYVDMVDLWRFIQYHPMYWNKEQIEATAEGHLILSP